MNTNERQLPHDPQAEKVVLGTILSERNALSEVTELLTPECFYTPFHRKLFEAALSLSKKGIRPDIISVANELQKESPEICPNQITEIGSCRTFDLFQHAALLFDKAQRRKFFSIGNFLLSNAYNETEDIADISERAQQMLQATVQTGSWEVSSMRDAIDGVYSQMEANATGKRAFTGFSTGFPDYDRKSGGLQSSDLIVIAAETSQGKSSLAIKLAMNAEKADCPIAFYSMEMKKEQIAARMVSVETGIPANEILYSRLSAESIVQVSNGASRISGRRIWFDDRSSSRIDSIISSIRAMKTRFGIKGAVIDYLQILSVNMRDSNQEQQMGEVARRLKNLAKELDIWIIALSQLSRDRDNPVPSLSRLRSSGQIAEAADVVWLIYRPEVYGREYPAPFNRASTEGTALIDIAKGRNIGILKFICGFRQETTDFFPLGPNQAEPFPQNNKDEFPF